MTDPRAVETGGPCPIAGVMQVFGGKWKTTILYHLHQHRILRFGELRRLIPRVSQRMLTLKLRELERDGLVRREQFLEMPPRVEYSATALADSLVPLFDAIERWGDEQGTEVAHARERYDGALTAP